MNEETKSVGYTQLLAGLIDKYKADWKIFSEKIRLADTQRKTGAKHYLKGRKDALTEIINDLVEIKSS